MTFDEAFDTLLGHEGGYSNHADDPGGETMWGITFRVARANGYHGPMIDMPQSVAKTIYRKLYWDTVEADRLPEVLRYTVFDAAVNSGPSRAIAWLQRALDVGDDGKLGDITWHALEAADPLKVGILYNAERLDFMTSLPTWKAFGKGWARRIVGNLRGLT